MILRASGPPFVNLCECGWKRASDCNSHPEHCCLVLGIPKYDEDKDVVFDFRGAENFPKPKGYEEASKNFKWDEEKENWVKVEEPLVVHTPYESLPENSVDLGKVCRDVVEDLVKDSKSTQVGGTHYAEMSVQPWDAMRAWMSPEEYTGYHVGTVLGYLSRHKKKGGLTDIQKAKHHLEELIRYFEVDEEYPW
jgi:hypothetical protein